MAAINCRHFNGYKPCAKQNDKVGCNSVCHEFNPVDGTVVIVHLGAIGAVVRSTSLLKSLRKENPNKLVIWITSDGIKPLIDEHPSVDKVVGYTEAHQILVNLRPERMYVIDKCLKAVGLVDVLCPKEVLGFKKHPNLLSIVPANDEAIPLWNLGLSNHEKFFVNQKSEVRLTAEALRLNSWQEDDYHLPLTFQEIAVSKQRRKQYCGRPDGNQIQNPIVGINTGCSNVIQYKKMSVDLHVQLIRHLQNRGIQNIVLLGGPEDQERNDEIAFLTEGVHLSPTNLGLRDGLCSVDACDIVITGDSLGMHMAIARQKWVVAWFGPTCAHEIELFGRGEKVLVRMPCSPCWKRTCEKNIRCHDLVSVEEIYQGVEKGIHWMYDSDRLAEIQFSE